MSKSTAQLRAALAEALGEYKADQLQQTPAGDNLVYAAETLLEKLDSQPSRRGKPYRVTFQHTKGALAGQVFENSVSDLSQAVAHMRTVISVGGRVALSIRDDSGEWHEKDALYLSAMGYNDIAASPLYGDKHYSQEA
jgi:hypothetical protein